MGKKSTDDDLKFVRHSFMVARVTPSEDLSQEDVQSIVDTYNAKENEAPVTVGHPESNSPAFGWIKKLYLKGKDIWAEADLYTGFHKML